MTPEEHEEQRVKRETAIRSAWSDLVHNKDFATVLDQDLQVRFNPFSSTFQQADGYNSRAAAKRDGNKEVIAYILGKLQRGRVDLERDETQSEKPTESL